MYMIYTLGMTTKGNQMTTTASFETGSEFRAEWTESRPAQRRVNGVMMSVSTFSERKSDIFSTYEEAQSVLAEVMASKKIGFCALMVRLPGNKRFTMDFNAKKA